MRSESMIQSTHEALVAVLTGEVDLNLSEHEMSGIRHTVDALCWVLEHSHNEALAIRLQTFHKAFRAAGINSNQGRTPPAAVEKGGK